jgi:hypothetical protein
MFTVQRFQGFGENAFDFGAAERRRVSLENRLTV